MAVKTAQASGNASAGATWVGGVAPADGDTYSIGNFNITQDVSITLGTDAGPGNNAIVFTSAGQGSYTIASGVTVTVKGDIQMAGNNSARNTQFTVNGSLVWYGANFAYRLRATASAVGDRWLFRIIGSSAASLATMTTSPNTHPAYYDRNGMAFGGYFDLQFASVSYFGDASNYCFQTYLDNYGDGYFSAVDSKADNCGLIANIGSMQPGATITLTRFVTTNELNANSISFSCDSSTVTAVTLTDCYFSAKASFNCSGGTRAVNITGTTFAGGLDSSGSTAFRTWDNNLVVIPNGGTMIQTPGPATTGNYYYHSSVSNPHWIALNDADPCDHVGDIFECGTSATDGDVLLSTGPASSKSITVRNCLVLPNADDLPCGSLLSMIGNSNWHVTVSHNTWASDGTGEPRGCGYGETNAGYADEFVYIKSNLAFHPSLAKATILARLSGSSVQDVVTGGATSVDYNGYWNVLASATDGHGVHAQSGTTVFSNTTGLGSHDVPLSSNPFVDWTRKLKKWSVSLGQASTASAALSILQSKVDITQSSLSASGTVSNLIAYVKTGYNVTASSLQNAGHDGATIGAQGFSTASINKAALTVFNQFALN